MALRLIFSTGGRLADDPQVMEFLQYADSRGISTRDIWVAERAGRVVSAVLPVYSPGRTVLLLPPGDAAVPTPPAVNLPAVSFSDPSNLSIPLDPSEAAGEDIPAIALVVDAVCTAALVRGTHLAQVLLDPLDSSALSLYIRLGFKRMAELLYLQTSVRRCAPIPPLPSGFAWVGYSPETHTRFAAAIAESYRDSLDCPGLNGLRDIEDVIAGHKVSGEFDPGLWFLLEETVSGGNGIACRVPRAVLVLSRLPRSDAVELVYLGLTPAVRGRGLGAMVLRHALGTVARIERARLTLAVDSANVPALKLYYRQGMQQVASKVAMMRDLRVNPSFTGYRQNFPLSTARPHVP